MVTLQRAVIQLRIATKWVVAGWKDSTVGTAYGPGDSQRTGFRYRLVVPDEWSPVDLDPDGRERSVLALVERQFAGTDNTPQLQALARQELLAKAEAAHAAGGLDMFVLMQEVGGVPLATSLVVFQLPPHQDGQAADAGRLAEALHGGNNQVSVIDLPAGKSVRVLRYGAPADDEAGADTATLEVFVPVPDTGAWLLLYFSAPFSPHAPTLTKLFDAICATLRWDE